MKYANILALLNIIHTYMHIYMKRLLEEKSVGGEFSTIEIGTCDFFLRLYVHVEVDGSIVE